MQKSTETRYAAYRSLFRVKTVLYQIGDIRLWMPIDRDLILLWVQTFVLSLVLYYVIPVLAWVSPFGPALTLSMGPAGLAYLLHKLDPAGKSTSTYLKDILRYVLGKKYVRRLERISPPRPKRTVYWAIRGRRVHRVDVDDDLCIKFFMAEALQGTLEPRSILRVYPPSKIRWHARVHRFSLTPLPPHRERKAEDIRSTRRGRTWSWTVMVPADITVQAGSAKAGLHQRRDVG